MVNMVKKVQKKGADLLLDGEEVRAASLVTVVGGLKKQAAFGAAGGLVGTAIGVAMGDTADEVAEGTLASTFPLTKPSILAITNQRWVLFEQGAVSGGPKSVLGQWGLDQITGIAIEAGRIMCKIDITFVDGSVAQAEAVKAAKPQKLSEAMAG